MKKLLAFTLAALMMCLMTVPAMAADTVLNAPGTGNTTLTYSVVVSYQVTIPAEVAINTETKTGTLALSVAENALIAPANAINIKLTTCDFELTNGDDSLTYTVKDGDTPIALNGVVHTHAAGTLTASSNELTLAITENVKYAGNYTDSITFTVSVDAVS